MKHFIGLIYNHTEKICKGDRFFPHMIHKPTGRSHDHMDAPLKLFQLDPVTLAPVHGQYIQPFHPCTICFKGIRHLNGQLPGGGQHQHLGSFIVKVNPGQQGQCKGRCLAGTGPGLAQHILSLDQMGNSQSLDRRGGLITHILQYREYRGVQVHFIKPGLG